MSRLFVGLVILGVFLTGAFWALNTKCPMMIDGPSYVIARTKSDLSGLESAISAFRLNESRYPASLQELVDRSYLDRLPIDLYGTSYNLLPQSAGLEFNVYSSGPNRVAEIGDGDDIVVSGKSYDCPEYSRCPTLCERSNYTAFAATAVTWLATCLFWRVIACRTVYSKLR